MNKIVIVSPSGNFYGSEQVLFDYLVTTVHSYDIYLPSGLLYDKLTLQRKHVVHLFSSVILLYCILFVFILFGKYDSVYINEAGHIKYLKLLARIFSKKKFFVHIRLLEDCKLARLGRKVENISYISISKYISNEVFNETGIHCATIYDLYKPVSGYNDIRFWNSKQNDNYLRLGIIGRVTPTKGLNSMIDFCNYCEERGSSFKLEFHFFGGVDDKHLDVASFLLRAGEYKHIRCVFHGFVNSKNEMYQSIDCLLHFNKVEAWGRIILEALDYGIPFIGFSEGGVGELAVQLTVEDLMVKVSDSWKEELYKRILSLFSHTETLSQRYLVAKNTMLQVCKPETYTQQLEKLFYD